MEYETDRRARLSRAQSAPRARASARAMTDVPVIDLVSSPSEEDARVVDADARTRGDAGRQRAGAGGTGRKKRRVADVVLVDERGGTGRSRDERAGTRARASAAVGGGFGACAVCLEAWRLPTATRCGHVFCARCLTAAMRHGSTCPTCRKRVTKASCVRVYL